MAKKIEIKKTTTIHRDCLFCTKVEDEFLNYEGKPIMGYCIFLKNRFLLNEKTDCKKYKK